MTQEEKRIKLAEARGAVKGSALGYTFGQANEFYLADPNGDFHDISDWSKRYRWLRFYDPFEDLNAVHELVNILSYEQAELFEDELCDLVMRSIETIENPPPFKFAVANATAAQRCEALGLALNLWT